MKKAPIATITENVIRALKLDCEAGVPIYLGKSNIEHMEQSHPEAYAKYSKNISEILNKPEYVGLNPSDGSIEYVKEYRAEQGEFVKVAVRVSLSGRYYARSLYVLNPNRVRNFVRKGTLKHLHNDEK
jgi:hypothetical protein